MLFVIVNGKNEILARAATMIEARAKAKESGGAVKLAADHKPRY